MRRLVVFALLAGLTLGVSAPAYAGHEHDLMKDGVVLVDDVAHGQTSQFGTNGCHAFHSHVHKGVMNELGKGISPTGPAQVTLVGETNFGC
jgi:hypothetical protein